MANLAMAYYSREKFADAETLNISVLERLKEVVAEDSLGIMNILNNLGMVYHQIGSYGNALELFQEALESRECLLGKDHPDSTANLHNIGRVFMAQGNCRTHRRLWKSH